MKKLLSIFLLTALSVSAAIKTETVEYQEGGTTLEGFLVYDDAILTRRPGVLIVHQWKGPGDYEKKRAEMLAKMGYVAFVADIYGKGVRPAAVPEAAATAARFRSGDRGLLRKRVNAGLEQLRRARAVDGERIAAIGYCFGGTTVLELARSGANLAGVVSFHGGLSTPNTGDARNIKAKVLALHGADDPHVPPAEVQGFEEEMRKAKVDWQLISYGNSVHSFTLWDAGSDHSTGSAYNQVADKRSWEAMRVFFNEIFDRKG